MMRKLPIARSHTPRTHSPALSSLLSPLCLICTPAHSHSPCDAHAGIKFKCSDLRFDNHTFPSVVRIRFKCNDIKFELRTFSLILHALTCTLLICCVQCLVCTPDTVSDMYSTELSFLIKSISMHLKAWNIHCIARMHDEHDYIFVFKALAQLPFCCAPITSV